MLRVIKRVRGTMPKPTKYLKVMIGRFQPLHNGHLKGMRAAIDTSDLFLVVIGSAQMVPRTLKNPFDSYERANLIWLSLTPAEREKTVILFQEDIKTSTCNEEKERACDQRWVKMVRSKVTAAARGIFGKNVDFHYTLTGCHKGADTYYLNLYEGWDRDLIPVNQAMNATDVRAAYFSNDHFNKWSSMVPPAVAGWLLAFRDHSRDYLKLKRQFEDQNK